MLLEKINNEIKSAMVSKDTDKRDVLRSVKSRANIIAKENHCEISDEILVKAVQKEMKELTQALDSFKGNSENEVYKGYKYRVDLLEEYLPSMMSEDEVRKAVAKILDSLGDVPFGKKMQAVMGELKGKADGKLIQKIVKEH